MPTPTEQSAPWRVAAFQTRHAAALAALGALVAALCVPQVSQLGLDSSWSALLPDQAPSVRDLARAESRVGVLETLTVAVKSPSNDRDGMSALASALVARIETLPNGVVSSVDWDRAAAVSFHYRHRHLYAPLESLEQTRDELAARRVHETRAVSPLRFEDDAAPPPSLDAILTRLDVEDAPTPEFFAHPDGNLVAFFVRANISGSESLRRREVRDLIAEEVEAVDPGHFGDDLEVVFAGPMALHLEDEASVARELVVATVITCVLVLILVWFFFRKLRAVALLAGALLPPVLLTFAVAEWTVEDLNTSTLFLGSIVVGNGVNPNIIWLARFFEERRKGHELRAAIARTHQMVWLGTLTASTAAAVAYASLAITDFRGFRDFGIIGGVGMILCWVFSLALLPALTALLERVLPFAHSSEGSARGLYTALFTRLVFSRPRAVLVLSGAVSALAIALVTMAVLDDPMEHDFRELQSDPTEHYSVARPIDQRVAAIAGDASADEMVVVLDERGEVAEFEATLEALRSTGAPWGEVHSIDDLLPDDQERKLPVLAEIRAHLLELWVGADEATRKRILEEIPDDEPSLVDDADLPSELTWRLREQDGTIGLLLRVEPAGETWDGGYLVRWAEALREVRTPSGDEPTLVGRAPIFADIEQTVLRDGPKAVLLSLLATMVLCMLTFRTFRERLLTVMALLLGILWMAGTMVLLGMRLNFLNFVAFPISFGNGVDYGVNVMRRYSDETSEGHEEPVMQAIRATGGAVVLCSLTTVIGYASLFTSANHAINSFGAAMVVSEVTCLLSAVLTMPAVLILLDRRRARR